LKRRKIIKNNVGSVYPVLILFILIGIVSLLVLILNEVYNPMYQLMNSEDDSIHPALDAPRRIGNSFIQLMWPKGVLLAVFFALLFALLMDYQKKQYQGG